MFHTISEAMARRMAEMEAIDARDRVDGTPKERRMRQIPPETGRFLALLAANVPAGNWIEIGCSAGYSTLWLSLAARAAGTTITTYELLPGKVALAAETFAQAGVSDVVQIVPGDARDHLPSLSEIAFCFLDAEKEIYEECYELVVPRLAQGGLLVADNAISHGEIVKPLIERALADPRVDALVVPIGKGELLCRKI